MESDKLDETLRLKGLSHPLRAALSEEMHLRKLPHFAAPAQVMQIVALLGERDAASSRDHVATLCSRHSVPLANPGRHFMCQLEGLDFVWEQHTEMASYTFIARGSVDTDPFEAIARECLEGIPGQVIRATKIALIGQDAPAQVRETLGAAFLPDDLVTCDLAEGRARILSDFRIQEDGFGRLLVIDQGLSGHEGSQLVQRAQELGNYRNMALLGLPVAQRLSPQVSALEQQLAQLTASVAAEASDDDQLLEQIGFLSAELARIMAETRYRMSATRAYAELVNDRLRSLQVGALRGHPTLTDFTERRLVPAMRTCASFSQRLDDLSQRVAWTSALLRTRVDTELARQNRDLLDSMNRRATMQLRLQQTVEGLSAVAISYYLVGLLGYLYKALHQAWPWLQPEAATGLSVPVVVGLVWLAMRRVRRHLHLE